MFDKFKNEKGFSFPKAMLYILITFGFVLIIMLFFTLDFKNYLGPIAILLASQIAGYSVITTINNTNRIEQEKEKEEERKTKKVLSSYFRHLLVLAEEQIKYFHEAEERINKHPTTHLKHLMIAETSFEDELNTIAFINPIESMLNPDLHKHSDAEMLDLILNIKDKTLKMIHNMKILKSTLVDNNEKDSVLTLLIQMQSDIKIMIQDCEKYTNMT
ncbi:hypothetical protein MN086_09100 [Sulfurovum sp. XGS-02]|uniref:hypothetical protein n=1 Tax=Sulfurovum sp. XGS-02 TaxID=2925411 RepID=UPI002058543B|nr:hypothetical protein [Sulfurovum sp. XGS-02]UPT77205.1 hypothetical protein MN086_09100 [Sulfurovum sp. XGS-02]